MTLPQNTAYPESEHIDLQVAPDAPVEFDLRLRIPAWLDRPASISVNGKAASVKAARGTFATIRRRWRKGDTVELTLPFSFRAVPIDKPNPDTVAVMYGPVMLCAIDPPHPLEATAEAFAHPKPVPGQPPAFDLRTPAGKVRLRPFYQVRGETYSTYAASSRPRSRCASRRAPASPSAPEAWIPWPTRPRSPAPCPS